MTDREKVINIYANCIINDNACCSDCYIGGPGFGCRQQVLTDALYLLKEQEPVEPEMEGGGSSWWHVCGKCHGMIDKNDLFCRHCGRPVKQT